jgi:hypothetical protein
MKLSDKSWDATGKMTRFFLVLGMLSMTLTSRVAAQEPITLVFDPLGDIGGRAVATIMVIDGTVTVTVEAFGLEPGARYSVQTHAGTCELQSASVGFLGILEPDETGVASLTSISAEASASGVTGPLDFILDGPHTLDIFHAPDTRACHPILGTSPTERR